MTTLAIETSTPRGSVAVCAGDALLFSETFTADRSHSASLFAVLERALAAAPRLGQIAVGLGPGSFAGVRIAIAAALGLHLATGARLVGIPSVAALEVDAPEFLAVGDARRESFYFTRVEAGLCTDGPRLLSAPDLRAVLASAGGLPVFATEPLALVPEARLALPSAVVLAQLAAANRGITQTDNLEPIYLREPHITLPKTRSGAPHSPR